MQLKKELLRKVGLNVELERLENNCCPTCGDKIIVHPNAIFYRQIDKSTRNLEDLFRDDFSFKEYSISGMCQKCQDKIFG